MKKQKKLPPINMNQKPLNAESAQKILKEDGLEVTLEEASKILALLRDFAKITVEHYILKKDKKRR